MSSSLPHPKALTIAAPSSTSAPQRSCSVCRAQPLGSQLPNQLQGGLEGCRGGWLWLQGGQSGESTTNCMPMQQGLHILADDHKLQCHCPLLAAGGAGNARRKPIPGQLTAPQ